MRVLYVRNARGIDDITGGESYLLSLMEPADRQSVHLACVVDPKLGHTRWQQELKRRQVPHTLIPVSTPFSIRDVRAVLRLIREFDPDVVHSIDHRADIVAVIAARLTNKAVVASFFGWTNWDAKSTRGRLYPIMNRLFLRHADAIISDSEFIGGLLNDGQAGTPRVVVHQGADLSRFQPERVEQSLRRRFFDEDDILLLGMVGRIHPNKGQLDVVRAAHEFISHDSRARVVIIGEPQRGFEDYARQLHDLIDELDLKAQVHVTNVLRDEVPAALAAMDVLLAPSYIESFSFAILEAMAMGKPVIASSAGGNPELVLEGVTGELVPAGDSRALATAVNELLADADKRARFGASGRHRVESELNLPSMRQRTYSVYREVIDWRSRNRAARSDLRERLATLG